MLSKEKAEEVVKKLVDKSISRFKQEFEGENNEVIDRVIRQFRGKLSRNFWRNSQKWCKWDDDGPVLMPDNTRIYYRKGDTEVVVQEFPPQVRLLKFRNDIVDKNREVENPKPVYHFSLALPYTVFLFKFVGGMFTEVRCAFNDQPLKRLKERPLRPCLSNIDANLTVCLGAGFDRSKLEKDKLAQQVAFVLDHFWNSVFTDEWSVHFWNTVSQTGDSRLATFEAWQEATEKDPLFVIDDVNWLSHNEEQFGDILVRMLEDDNKNVKLLEELYNDLVEEFLREVQKSYAENLNSTNMPDAFLTSLSQELLTELGEC